MKHWKWNSMDDLSDLDLESLLDPFCSFDDDSFDNQLLRYSCPFAKSYGTMPLASTVPDSILHFSHEGV